MNQGQYDRVRAVFLIAVELGSTQVQPYLDRACTGDKALRIEVEELLAEVTPNPIFESVEPADDPLGIIGSYVDEFRVDAFITTGGFSYIYRGWCHSLQAPVALKLFRRPLLCQPEAPLEWAFEREAEVLLHLSHKTTATPRVAKHGRTVDPRGTLLSYCALEWLEGRTLAAQLAEEGSTYSVAQMIHLLNPIVEALSVAHTEDIVHRDLKPDNIFLEAGGGARLLDFGNAEQPQTMPTNSNEHLAPFTPNYAAPEQVGGTHGPTGPWTDVHGLALVAIELLAGRRPYEGGTLSEVLAQVVDPRRPTPRALGVDVSPQVEQLFERALALDSKARPVDVQSFWSDLHSAVDLRPAVTLN